MDIQYRREYSGSLYRDMEYKIYGYGGIPCIYFPCQDGRFFDFENFGVIDWCRQYIEEGRIKVYSVDTVDTESLSALWKAPCDRIARHEQYFHYISDELAPVIMRENPWWQDTGILVMGFSMGAYHSANMYFRRPDIFRRNLSLSGVYEIKYIIDGYSDLLTFLNSPVDSLINLPENHYYMDFYRSNRAVFCTGQGAYENPMQESTRYLDTVMCSKGIPARFEYWGYDVCHDWNWWNKEFSYLFPLLL